MANQYIDYPLVADARDLMQRCFDFMATKFDGWEPSEGQLDTALIEGISSEAADIASLTTEVPKSIFRYFGATMLGIAPLSAVSATATTTWFATDNLGHIIPAGSQVTLIDGQGNPVPFTVLTDVTIAPGSTQTSAGGVTIIAVVPGGDSSGVGSVGAAVQAVDIFPWIDHITQATVSTGGVDAESDDEYLNRLSLELSLISPAPIVPNDFAILARNADATVQRATCIDGYNTADSSTGNQRMVTIAAIDVNGVGVSGTVKTKIQTYLNSLREINFVINMTDPTTTPVDVTVNVAVESGWVASDVQARVLTALQAFLSPANWGIDPSDDPNDPVTWNNTPVVGYINLATVINNVPGVGVVTSLTIGLNGGAQSASDKTLTGVAPLPSNGTFVVTTS